MQDPQTTAAGEGGNESLKKGVLVRGANGALYILTEKDLQPFRVPEEKTAALEKILGRAPKEAVVRRLTPNVMAELQSLARSVDAPVEVFLPSKE